MEKYKLEKAKIINIDTVELIKKLTEAEDIQKYIDKTNTPDYLYWDEIKYRPYPNNMTVGEFWEIVKLLRKSPISRRQSIVKTEEGEYFTWQNLPDEESFLYGITKQNYGMSKPHGITNDNQGLILKNQSSIEEAIASSQLEGAATTSKVAKKMILDKRKPKNKSEQMIVNNYKTIMFIERKLQNKELSLENLCELQSMLTEKTLNDSERGRLRKNSDEIFVINESDGKILHEPPKEKFLQKEIIKLIDYANDKITDNRFIHPVIKAIIIHFWIGYLHPFCDGNGRLARIIFDWYLLKHSYWIFSYLPLSKLIKKSPIQYRNAYLYSEQDNFDLTYFIDYIIKKIKLAKIMFDEEMITKVKLRNAIKPFDKLRYNLNERQKNLLSYLKKNSSESTSISTHSTINVVSRMTARKDLVKLKEYGFLTTKKIGKYVHYYATEKVNELFEK